MPNKYSHSVVLAHYSSLGLIDLPNDQYITYLKYHPSSRPPSSCSRFRVLPNGTPASIGSSHQESRSTSNSVRGRRGHDARTNRDIIDESDEDSADEAVRLHRFHEPATRSARPFQSSEEAPITRTEKKNKIPSVSTYTGRSSSEGSERFAPIKSQKHVPAQHSREPKASPPSIINLNDFDSVPGRSSASSRRSGQTAPPPPPPSERWSEYKTTQNKLVYKAPPSSYPRHPRTDPPPWSPEPNFEGFSDQHFSDPIVSGNEDTHANSNGAGKRSQVEQAYNHTNPNSPPPHDPTALPERLDSLVADNQHNAPGPRQPRPGRSYESISSINSGDNDVNISTTALPPMVPPKPEKHLRTGPIKTNLTSPRPRDDADVIDPRFFEALRTGPRQAAASSIRQGSTGVHSNLQSSSSRTSQQYSRQSADHAPNPDFWRGLEEMLSDSDASVVFPPDIAKYKSRDGNPGPASTADPAKIPRNRTTDNPGLKRPTTAPAPRTTTTTITGRSRIRDLIHTNEPHPTEGGRKTNDRTAAPDIDTDTDTGPSNAHTHIYGQQTTSPDKFHNGDHGGHGGHGTRPMTTVQLVDTSSNQPKRTTRRFLRKLRKKSYKGVDG